MTPLTVPCTTQRVDLYDARAVGDLQAGGRVTQERRSGQDEVLAAWNPGDPAPPRNRRRTRLLHDDPDRAHSVKRLGVGPGVDDQRGARLRVRQACGDGERIASAPWDR